MPRVTPNFLRKIIAVQEITLRETAKGRTQKWIFENLIEADFFISKATYDRYLARNAKKQLKELEKSQLTEEICR